MEFNEPCDTAANYRGQNRPYDFTPFLEEGQKAGIVVKADRLEDLGAKAGINAEKGAPIPGLWVAGADAGGMYGNSYVQVEGGTLGFAYTSGRIAGQNAAASALAK
jgi:hypothetical protein